MNIRLLLFFILIIVFFALATLASICSDRPYGLGGFPSVRDDLGFLNLAGSLFTRDPVELEEWCDIRDTGRDGPAEEAPELYSASLSTSSGLLMVYKVVCSIRSRMTGILLHELIHSDVGK
jgi:hypothetical protein